jgi:NAD(P)H-quinone oxidoreductase subunit 5
MTVEMPSIPLTVLVLVGVGALLLMVLGLASLVNRPLPERWTGALSGSAMAISCAALLTAFVVNGMTATGTQLLSYGAWSTSYEGGIAIEFLVDRLSLAFAVLSTAIAGVVSAFSNRYLHREPGYNRYFVLLAIFVTGMLLVALAGNVAVLFIGWEFVGLSSAMLVAFFQERRRRSRMRFAWCRSTASATQRCCLPRCCCGTWPAPTACRSSLAARPRPPA